MGKILIYVGIYILMLGILIHFYFDKTNWFGNLFGDIKIIKSNFQFHFPFMSMIVISVILSIIINIINRFNK